MRSVRAALSAAVALLIVVAAFGGAFDLGEVGEYFSRNITW